MSVRVALDTSARNLESWRALKNNAAPYALEATVSGFLDITLVSTSPGGWTPSETQLRPTVTAFEVDGMTQFAVRPCTMRLGV